jgi:hypothetical protein
MLAMPTSPEWCARPLGIVDCVELAFHRSVLLPIVAVQITAATSCPIDRVSMQL